jgi:ABC-type transporter Mla maintaining outer membrane lipid asymmetry ATPase subunit MlaF
LGDLVLVQADEGDGGAGLGAAVVDDVPGGIDVDEVGDRGVAIAILGNPPIVLLDEPSAGMDPEARRFMW